MLATSNDASPRDQRLQRNRHGTIVRRTHERGAGGPPCDGERPRPGGALGRCRAGGGPARARRPARGAGRAPSRDAARRPKRLGRAPTRLRDHLAGHVRVRARSLDAPLVVLLLGPTGAGKSTLFNTLAGRPASPTGVLRPTTRTAIVLAHPDDVAALRDGHARRDRPGAAPDRSPTRASRRASPSSTRPTSTRRARQPRACRPARRGRRPVPLRHDRDALRRPRPVARPRPRPRARPAAPRGREPAAGRSRTTGARSSTTSSACSPRPAWAARRATAKATPTIGPRGRRRDRGRARARREALVARPSRP